MVRLLLLAMIALGAVLASVWLGAVGLGMGEVAEALWGRGDPMTRTIIRDLRLPRAVLAALVGCALGLSGATFQALLRNPLAEPYILGVSGGAAVGAVAAIVLGWAATAEWSLPLAAFGGALLAIVLVLRIAASVGRALDTRVLLLAGVVVGAFFNACILLALVFAEADSFRSAIFWMMGSLSGATWRATGVLTLYLIPAMVVLVGLARPLNLLAIGEDTAAHLGTSVERTKWIAYGTASLLTAAAVAASGVIGFVGLVIPHVIRIAWGSNYRFLLPASALLGAAFLTLADTLARTVAAPTELPVGVVTAFVGVPFFVWLLVRRSAAVPSTGYRVPSTEPEQRPSPAATPYPSPGTGRTAAWRCEGLSFRYPGGGSWALEDVTVELPAGMCTAVIGPNGSGKSTLLQLLLGTLEPASGQVIFGGRPVAEWGRSEMARAVGVVPQGEETVFPLTTRELVAMGRYPHLGPWRREREKDRRAIRDTMRLCDVEQFVDRPASTLSGGERQRARLARALAQEPASLALDEPTVALDMRHEMAILELLRQAVREGTTVLLITHNLNLAARYSDWIVLLDAGRVAAVGPVAEVLRRERLEAIYGWPMRVVPHPGPGPDTGVPQVVPLTDGPTARSDRRPTTTSRAEHYPDPRADAFTPEEKRG